MTVKSLVAVVAPEGFHALTAILVLFTTITWSHCQHSVLAGTINIREQNEVVRIRQKRSFHGGHGGFHGGGGFSGRAAPMSGMAAPGNRFGGGVGMPHFGGGGPGGFPGAGPSFSPGGGFPNSFGSHQSMPGNHDHHGGVKPQSFPMNVASPQLPNQVSPWGMQNKDNGPENTANHPLNNGGNGHTLPGFQNVPHGFQQQTFPGVPVHAQIPVARVPHFPQSHPVQGQLPGIHPSPAHFASPNLPHVQAHPHVSIPQMHHGQSRHEQHANQIHGQQFPQGHPSIAQRQLHALRGKVVAALSPKDSSAGNNKLHERAHGHNTNFKYPTGHSGHHHNHHHGHQHAPHHAHQNNEQQRPQQGGYGEEPIVARDAVSEQGPKRQGQQAQGQEGNQQKGSKGSYSQQQPGHTIHIHNTVIGNAEHGTRYPYNGHPNQMNPHYQPNGMNGHMMPPMNGHMMPPMGGGGGMLGPPIGRGFMPPPMGGGMMSPPMMHPPMMPPPPMMGGGMLPMMPGGGMPPCIPPVPFGVPMSPNMMPMIPPTMMPPPFPPMGMMGGHMFNNPFAVPPPMLPPLQPPMPPPFMPPPQGIPIPYPVPVPVFIPGPEKPPIYIPVPAGGPGIGPGQFGGQGPAGVFNPPPGWDLRLSLTTAAPPLTTGLPFQQVLQSAAGNQQVPPAVPPQQPVNPQNPSGSQPVNPQNPSGAQQVPPQNPPPKQQQMPPQNPSAPVPPGPSGSQIAMAAPEQTGMDDSSSGQVEVLGKKQAKLLELRQGRGKLKKIRSDRKLSHRQ